MSLGLRTYRTGRICRAGHDAERYTSTGGCVECLRVRNKDQAAAVREAIRPTDDGSRLFTYRLHPDDHAAALAYCQGLDLQRGRIPQAAPAIVEAPAILPPTATPEEIAHRRRQMFGAEPEPERRDLDPAMAAQLRAFGLMK